MIDDSRDSMIVVNSSHNLLKLVAIVLAKVKIKLFKKKSRDHMINGSRESVGEIPSSLITNVIVRATELSDKNIYVVHFGARLCFKLGQLCFITNQSKYCYKLGQLHYYKLGHVLLQIGAKFITNWDRYYKLGQLLFGHNNIHQLASLRFLKLYLTCQNIQMGRRTCEDLFFSFVGLCSKSASCNQTPRLFLLLQSFF